jgi:hydroxymethylpyrimidine pyrophosphatase-like HAD family hydrolase
VRHLPEKNTVNGKASGWVMPNGFPENLDEFWHNLGKMNLPMLLGCDAKMQLSPIRDQDQIQAMYGMGRTANYARNLDVLHSKAGKGSALRLIAQAEQPEEIMTVVDASNDIELTGEEAAQVLIVANADNAFRQQVVEIRQYAAIESPYVAGVALINKWALEGFLDLQNPVYADLAELM